MVRALGIGKETWRITPSCLTGNRGGSDLGYGVNLTVN